MRGGAAEVAAGWVDRPTRGRGGRVGWGIRRGVSAGDQQVCRGALAHGGSLTPVGERVAERPGEGVNRANHEPVTANTTRVAACGRCGADARPAVAWTEPRPPAALVCGPWRRWFWRDAQRSGHGGPPSRHPCADPTRRVVSDGGGVGFPIEAVGRPRGSVLVRCRPNGRTRRFALSRRWLWALFGGCLSVSGLGVLVRVVCVPSGVMSVDGGLCGPLALRPTG